jgi:hypothetical protein
MKGVFIYDVIYTTLPLWRPRGGWKDNIKMDLKKAGCLNMDLFNLTENWDQ